jgi:hypothetical protein
MKDLQLISEFNIFGKVVQENIRQLEKWGIQDHSAEEWFIISSEEVGEVAKAIVEWRFNNGTPADVAKEAVQAATLFLKIAEMFLNECPHIDS